MKYSATTKGFYDTAFSKNIPADAVEVSDIDYQQALTTPILAIKTKEELDTDAVTILNEKIKITAEQVLADLVIFAATLPGAPQSIKDAVAAIAIEKAKKPK